jgi:hypothetical protein
VYSRKLTVEEKERIRNGELSVSGRKHRSSSLIVQDNLIKQFLNRSQSQRGTRKPRKKKKCKQQPTEPVYPDNEKAPPSKAVEQYLQQLQTLKPNSFTLKRNKVLKLPLNEVDRQIVLALDLVPLYSLRYSNRIFCSGRWQTLRANSAQSGKPLRNLLFSDSLSADFRSLHFEIFRMLLKRYVPNSYHKLQKLLGGESVWNYLESTLQVVDKSIYKVAVQALINGSSKCRTLLRLIVDEEQLNLICQEEFVISRVEELLNDNRLLEFVETVYQGVKHLQECIKNNEVKDAFGQPLVPTTIQDFRNLTGEWLPKEETWRLIRKDLNRLYSSFELKLVTETVCSCIGKYEFRVDLHLHDGFLFSANKKSIEKVKKILKSTSAGIMKQIEIESELIV